MDGRKGAQVELNMEGPTHAKACRNSISRLEEAKGFVRRPGRKSL